MAAIIVRLSPDSFLAAISDRDIAQIVEAHCLFRIFQSEASHDKGIFIVIDLLPSNSLGWGRGAKHQTISNSTLGLHNYTCVVSLLTNLNCLKVMVHKTVAIAK